MPFCWFCHEVAIPRMLKGKRYTFNVKYFFLPSHLVEINLSKWFCLSSETGSTLKGKNLLIKGTNSFHLIKPRFR